MIRPYCCLLIIFITTSVLQIGCENRFPIDGSKQLNNPSDLLPLSLDLGSDLTISLGDSVVLNAKITGGLPPYAYSWDPPTGLDNASIGSPRASPTETTSYHLHVTDSLQNSAFASITIFVHNAPASCLTSSSSWLQIPFEQSTRLQATFDVRPLAEAVDGVVAFSPQPGTDWNQYAMLVRFSPDGAIDIRSNTSYKAENELLYSANTLYHIRLEANILSHTYSVYAREHGRSEVVLALDYPFRDGHASDTYMAYTGLYASSGPIQLCNLAVTRLDDDPALIVNAGGDKYISSGESATLDGQASGGTAPYVYSWLPESGLSDSWAAQPSASPTQTTTYTLTVTDRFGKTSSDSVVVTVATAVDPIALPQSTITEVNRAILITLTGTTASAPLSFTIDHSPIKGQLGTISQVDPTSANVLYTPVNNFQGNDEFSFFVTADGQPSAPATVSIVILPASTTDLPVGIPKPTFGLAQSHEMYATQQYNFGNGLEPYPNAGQGPYTHYVDTSHPSATDTNNPFGTSNKPRKTLPRTLEAGSVIEIHGGPYVNSQISIIANGTASKPVFFRGASMNNRAKLNLKLIISGQYVVFENIVSERSFEMRSDSTGCHHIAIRNCEIYGNRTDGSGGTISAVGTPALFAHDILIYRNHVRDGGDSSYTSTDEQHGISIKHYTSDIWVLENNVHHMAADSIQINGIAAEDCKRIYVGRNVFHDNRENAVDIKESEDIVISQNTMYGFAPTNTSNGTAMVVHYDARRLWFLYNEIHDSQYGIASTGSYNLYIIGNVIYNIRRMVEPSLFSIKYHNREGTAIRWYSTGDVFVLNNTIHNTVTAIAAKISAYRARIFNNIISTCTEGGFHINLYNNAYAESEINNNIFYQPSGLAQIRWGGSIVDLSTFKGPINKCSSCREANPYFINPSEGDFHLNSASPAIDFGVPDDSSPEFAKLYGLQLNQDFDNTARVKSAAIDCGAFEHMP